MSLRATRQPAADIRLPADIDWQMLDKSKFFMLGSALFSGVSAVLYPMVVLKTRQQVSETHKSCMSVAFNILRREGLVGMYRGFGTSLMGTIPARALYMGSLEITKSNVGRTAMQMGFSEPAASAFANAAGGVSASVAAQLVWTPVDVISQRLMVQGSGSVSSNYSGGLNAFGSIVKTDGFRGLYRGFGISVLTYAPSSALWWASYGVAQRMVWAGLGYFRGDEDKMEESVVAGSKTVVAVQGLSAALAGVTALVTTPLDTVKTRLQVLEGEANQRPSVGQTVRTLLKEGGWRACYRGLGPRWTAMSMSATTMITTYEFLKRLSTKAQDGMTHKSL
eukprot:Gb_36139 [translate_table: standard]